MECHLTFEDLIRDARNSALTPSTRVRAAFNAIATCWQVPEMLEEPPTALKLEHCDAARVRNLALWAMHEAPVGGLPMSPDDAVALAERVHATLGGN
jgi:hypothetical protein